MWTFWGSVCSQLHFPLKQLVALELTLSTVAGLFIGWFSTKIIHFFADRKLPMKILYHKDILLYKKNLDVTKIDMICCMNIHLMLF